MTIPSTETEILKTLYKELKKTFLVYDGSNRMITVYEARKDAVDGDACIVSYITYVGATTRIEKQKEDYSTWSSAYDI